MEYVKTQLKKQVDISGIYTIHYFEYTKDFAYSGEIHNFWEIVYADKKSVVITAGAEEMTLKAGQMYIHKPNEFHKIRCDGTSAANSVVISFDCECPELFSVAGTVLNCTAEERRLIGLIISEALDTFSNPLGNQYTAQMEKSASDDFANEQLIQLYIEQLLITLIRANKDTPTIQKKESNKLLIEICEYLESNIEHDLSFEDIRHRFNVSASVIKRLFHSNMNCGIMEHFLRLKIDAAKQMIRENELNFTEISEQLAFSSPQYFSAAFKRISGMSPSEYSRSVKSNFS